jgi:predicted sulfurtransferase
MRYILTLLMISALALLTGCQNAQSSTTETKNENPAPVDKMVEKTETKADKDIAGDGHDHDSTAPRIGLADAKKDFDSGEAVFIDTRSAVAYKNEHIKGAISVPAGQFEKTYKNVPKDKKIIAYCS